MGKRTLTETLPVRGYASTLEAMRAPAEHSFGVSLADAQVREDAGTQASLAAEGAAAQTQGNAIGIGAGAPPPDSSSGRFLVAHELAHVAQTRSPGPAADRSSVEADASRAAGAAMHGEMAGPLLAASAGGTYNLGEQEANEGGERGILDRAADAVGSVAREAIITGLVVTPVGAAAVALLRRTRPEWITDIVERLPDAVLRGFLDAVLTVGLGPFGPFLVRSGIIERVLRFASERFIRELMRIQREGLLPYIRHRLNELWPVGLGFRLEGNVGITFVYPIHVGGGDAMMLMKKADNVFELQRRSEIIVAGDTGVGIGVNAGVGRVGVHARAEAEAMAGTRLKLREYYDFPITTDQAFVSFLATVMGRHTQTIAQIASLFGDNLRGLSPENYLTEREMNYEQFARGDATAEAGLVRGGGQQGRETWGGRGEGFTDRPGHNPLAPARPGAAADQRQPWYMSILPRVAADLQIELAAGVGVQMNPQPAGQRPRRADQEIADPEYVDFEFTAEASLLLRGGANLAGVVPLIPQINANPGIGLQLVFRVNHSSSGQSLNPRFLRASLVLMQGDVDALSGSASETSIGVGVGRTPGAGDSQSLSQVLRDLAPEIRHQQRLVLAGAPALPRFLRAALDDKLGLGRTLQTVALDLEGQLRFDLHISANEAYRIMHHLANAARDLASTGGPQQIAQRVRDDFVSWVQTRTVPSYLSEAGQALQVLGTSTVDELVVAGDISFQAGADVRAAFGAKLRIRADGRAGVRFQIDLLRDGATTAANAVRLVREFLRDRGLDGGELLRLLGA